MAHLGNGIYEGVATLEDFQNGKAGVTLFACRDPYDWTHARYGNAGYTNDAEKDIIYDDLNRYRGDTKWLIPVGEYCIAFDMNHETNGELTIDYERAEVYDLSGRMVNGKWLDGRLPSGTYIIRTAKGSIKKAYK